MSMVAEMTIRVFGSVIFGHKKTQLFVTFLSARRQTVPFLLSDQKKWQKEKSPKMTKLGEYSFFVTVYQVGRRCVLLLNIALLGHVIFGEI